MKIYTRRGDGGETDLFGGPRVGKDDPRVVAYGGVDELNAVLGLAVGLSSDDQIRELVSEIQGTLFDLGAYLATPDPERRRKSHIAEPRAEDITSLETHIDAFDSELLTSIGLGLRASTPAGPIRLDVAFPLGRREGDDSVKFYLGFGNVF